jgi:hypothetical protein
MLHRRNVHDHNFTFPFVFSLHMRADKILIKKMSRVVHAPDETHWESHVKCEQVYFMKHTCYSHLFSDLSKFTTHTLI